MAVAEHEHERADAGIATYGTPSSADSASPSMKTWRDAEYDPIERDKRFREQVERELKRAGITPVSKGKDKNRTPSKQYRSTLYVEEDFPRIINGINYQTLAEYEEHTFGSTDHDGTVEMRGSDNAAYDSQWDMSEEEWKQYMDGLVDAGPRNYSNYAAFDDNFRGYSSRYSYSKKTKLKVGTWKILDRIKHMTYAILRGDNGKYFCVWLSRSDDKQEENILNKLLTMKLPLYVTEFEGGRAHTSEPYKEYDSAYSRFSCGGESFSYIRTRIGRAEDPNWIPPNLRMAAFEGRWDVIPNEYIAKCRDWFDKGCPGWYGTWHRQKSVDRLKAAGQAIPFDSGKPTQLSLPEGSVRKQMMDVISGKKSQVTREVAVKGDTGCPVIQPLGNRCGSAIKTGRFCEWHNDLFKAGAPLQLVKEAPEPEDKQVLGNCRLRVFRDGDFVVCNDPIHKPPYCDGHNKSLFIPQATEKV